MAHHGVINLHAIFHVKNAAIFKCHSTYPPLPDLFLQVAVLNVQSSLDRLPRGVDVRSTGHLPVHVFSPIHTSAEFSAQTPHL